MKKFSWTLSIILVNFVILLSIEFSGGPNVYNLLNFGGQFGPLINNGEYYRFVTALFVHAGWLHLLFNMYALYYFGRLVENVYGSSKFIVVYLLTGLAGNLLSQFFYYSVPSVGASGAIFGLIGLLLGATYFRHEFPDQVKRQMYFLLIPVVLFNVVYGFIPGTDINNAAHLGGFGSGLVLGIFLSPMYRWSKLSNLWKAGAIASVFLITLSFVGLAFNNSIVTLNPAINFANSYANVLNRVNQGSSVSQSSLDSVRPFDLQTERLKNALLSNIKSGSPTVKTLNGEYESWIIMIKERYKGLIGVQK